MWIVVSLAISIIATGSGYLETVDAQQYWNYQDYPESPSYNTWSAPTGNEEHGLLQMVSRLCPNCLQSGGIDEVSGIPGLRNAIEYSYFNTIKPSMNEMFYKYGIDKGATYRYADSLCNRNSQMISFLPGNDVVDMICSDIHQTVQQENL